MATYYAVNAGGTWGTAATWSTVAAKDATRVGNGAAPTNADTCYIDDYSGSVTMGANGTCKDLDFNSNGAHTGTFTASTRTVTVAGNLTLSAGMTLSFTTGNFSISAASTITSNGQTIPRLYLTGPVTYTLADALSATVLYVGATTVTMAGAFNITCTTFSIVSAYTFKIVSGQTLTINTNLGVHASGFSAGLVSFGSPTIQAVTASSTAYIVYNGTIANSYIINVKFTDIDATGGTHLYNYQGGALTRTSGITNIVLPPAGGASTCVGLVG